jgi:hypothetical protein
MDERGGTFPFGQEKRKSVDQQQELKNTLRAQLKQARSNANKNGQTLKQWLIDEGTTEDQLNKLFITLNEYNSIPDRLHEKVNIILYNIMRKITNMINCINKWHYGKILILWMIVLITLFIMSLTHTIDEPIMLIWLLYVLIVVVLSWKWLSYKERKN